MILPEGRRATHLQRTDPRARLLLALTSATALLALHGLPSLTLALAFFLTIAIITHGPTFPWRRFLLLNALMLGFLVVLPWSVPGRDWLTLGPFTYTHEGFLAALTIALRSNAIVLTLTAFIGTMDPITLGHTLTRFRLPARLIQLLLLTVRYIAVLEIEFQQLRRAMTLRCFEPRLNRHTLHTYGNLIGMLLVRALDRAERIHEAVLCRGFTGKYPTLYTHRWTLRDTLTANAVLIPLALLIIGDTLWLAP